MPESLQIRRDIRGRFSGCELDINLFRYPRLSGGDAYRFLLRMPQELRERLAASADASGRSLNREIVDRLERSFEREATRSEGRVQHMPRRYRRPAFALGLVAATAILVAAVAGVSHGTFSAAKSPKLGRDPDAQSRIAHKATNRSIPGGPSHEQLAGPASLTDEEIADRAYPSSSLPFSLQQAAAADFTNSIVPRGFFDASGGWNLVGPTTATYPGVLNRTSGSYVASGRITALALAGTCVPGNCRMWVAAAGGGIWRTDDALSSSPSWTFTSGSFGTNAIGTLTYDAAHDTLYAGTGEPNASGDSEAGVGIYKSTDGGTTWTLLPGSPAVMNARSISSIVVDPTNPDTIYVGTARGVRGVSAVTGGAISVAPDAAPTGLYKTTNGGTSFSLVWDGHASLRGVNHVELDSHGTIYAAAFQQGIWRSSNGGSTWEQVFATQDPTDNAARTEFALATQTDGHTRLYVGDGGTETGGLNSNGAPNSNTGFYRADSVDTKTAAALTNGTTNPGYMSLTSADRSTPGYATWDYCSGQCWYDNFVVSPPGHPDIVYVGGSYDYNFVNSRSNGKGVLLSQDGGLHFTDQTMAAGYVDGIHPDQHALVTLPSNPVEFWEGSDGGLMRSSGSLTNASADCNNRNLSPASKAGCAFLLAAIPTALTSLNTGLSTLQFQSVSLNPHDASDLQGGTQDNGTWEGTTTNPSWPQTMYGDGGQSGFDVGNSHIRFNNFFSPYTDENFRNGDPTAWVIISGNLFDPKTAHPKELTAFYVPEIGDPVVSGTQFFGAQHVWRTLDNGGDQTYLEANCPEFTTFGGQPGCGDLAPLGDPSGQGSSLDNGTTSPGDLTSTQYGTDRAGQYVVAIARAPSDRATMWVATRTGRVFISRNANAANPADVTFTRIDTLASNDPARFVSSIVVDPKNPLKAYLSYSGYNSNTPGQPGHVFVVGYDPSRNVATWTNVDRGTGPMGDLPVTGLAYDAKAQLLYASTDFGVLVQDNARLGGWRVASRGMPMVEVTGLTLDTANRVLYASTHGRGIWSLKLPPAPFGPFGP
jgi:hypothetical protein